MIIKIELAKTHAACQRGDNKPTLLTHSLACWKRTKERFDDGSRNLILVSFIVVSCLLSLYSYWNHNDGSIGTEVAVVRSMNCSDAFGNLSLPRKL